MRKTLIAILLATSISATSMAQQTPHDTEKSFVEFTDGIYNMGLEWSETGWSRQADWFFGQAAAAIAGWRTAIAEIGIDVSKDERKKILEQDRENAAGTEFLGMDLGDMLAGLQGLTNAMENLSNKIEKMASGVEKKAEALGMNSRFKIEDECWYSVRDYSLASPYPDYFRGLVHDWRGEAENAIKYYDRARQNPYFPGFVFDFSYLADLTYEELVALSSRLKAFQLKYEGAMERDSFHFDEDVPCWNADALARKAADLLELERPDNVGAQKYLEAAAHVNPFDVKYVYLCAILYSSLGNGAATVRHLNEALKMDPDNVKLQAAAR